METDKTCDFVALASKHLARQGLSWSYCCFAETKQYDDCLIGEGEMIIYYRGFDYPQHNHGRLSFIMEDDGTDNIFMLSSWGVQGPGEHFRFREFDEILKMLPGNRTLSKFSINLRGHGCIIASDSLEDLINLKFVARPKPEYSLT